MHIQNKSARLIDFSWNKEKYRLMPAGNAVEVPDKATSSAFLKALIKDGDVVEVKELTKEEKAAIELEAIQEQAKALGIEFDDSWTAKDLDSEIELVKITKQATDFGIEVKEGWDAKKLAAEIKKKEK